MISEMSRIYMPGSLESLNTFKFTNMGPSISIIRGNLGIKSSILSN